MNLDMLPAVQNNLQQSNAVPKFGKKCNWILKYFHQVTRVLFVCKICNSELKVTNKKTAHLCRHLMRRHQKVRQFESNKKENSFDIEQVERSDMKNDIELTNALNKTENNKDFNCTLIKGEENMEFQKLPINVDKKLSKEQTLLPPSDHKECDVQVNLSVPEAPDWVSLYFEKSSETEFKCNICEEIIITPDKDKELIEHIRASHKEIESLHKDNPMSSVGFQIEFLQFSMIKDDNTQPVILEEVCQDATEEIKTEKTDKDNTDMQLVLVPKKEKIKRIYWTNRKRSWVWKYFERLSSIIYRCNLCNVVLSIKGCNTNNMNRHVRTRHPGTYKSEVEKKKDSTLLEHIDLDKTDDYDREINESIDIIKQRRSWIWSYFNRISNTLAQCKLCGRNICHGGNATGNMNRHLKMIHNKTADGNSWVWKVFESTDDDFFTCKICQFKCMKFEDIDKSVKFILSHLNVEHGVVSGDQIITGSEYEIENTE